IVDAEEIFDGTDARYYPVGSSIALSGIRRVHLPIRGEDYVRGAYSAAYEEVATDLGRRPSISFSRSEALGMVVSSRPSEAAAVHALIAKADALRPPRPTPATAASATGRRSPPRRGRSAGRPGACATSCTTTSP